MSDPNLLNGVEADKTNGARTLALPKIETMSDINSDLNFLANTKKTFPKSLLPKPILPKPVSPTAPVVSSPLAQQQQQVPEDPIENDQESHNDEGSDAGDLDMEDMSSQVSSGGSIDPPPKNKLARDKPKPIYKAPKPMTEEEIRREKSFLLFQLESKNKDFRYSKAHMTMDNSLEEIKNEIELVNSKRTMETNMNFWRRGMVLFSEGMVYLNNTVDPFSVDMSDWSKQMAYEVLEEKSYDEMLEELVLKYKSAGISAPVELRLAMAIGASFGFGILAKKRENAILERLRQVPQAPPQQQMPSMTNQPTHLSNMHGPSMNADDVIRMMQQNAAESIADDNSSDTSSRSTNKKKTQSVVSDDQSVITVPLREPKKRGRKPKAKEPETVLKI